MKTTISKSEVMKQAWLMYRWDKLNGRLTTFAYYLKMAWKKVKECVKSPVTYYYVNPIEDYYHGAGSRGRYFGD